MISLQAAGMVPLIVLELRATWQAVRSARNKLG